MSNSHHYTDVKWAVKEQQANITPGKCTMGVTTDETCIKDFKKYFWCTENKRIQEQSQMGRKNQALHYCHLRKNMKIKFLCY
jgi:hypothetical protein